MLLSKVEVSFSSIDFIAHWERCGITADFFAKFMGENFSNKSIVISQLSTIFNELIENSVKFSSPDSEEIKLKISNFGSELIFEITNQSQDQVVESFKPILQELFSSEVEDLFIKKIINNAEQHENSQLGLITLIKDFGVKIGIKIFDSLENSDHFVHVKAIINLEEIDSL